MSSKVRGFGLMTAGQEVATATSSDHDLFATHVCQSLLATIQLGACKTHLWRSCDGGEALAMLEAKALGDLRG